VGGTLRGHKRRFARERTVAADCGNGRTAVDCGRCFLSVCAKCPLCELAFANRFVQQYKKIKNMLSKLDFYGKKSIIYLG